MSEVLNHRARSVPSLGDLASSVLILHENTLAETERRKVSGVLAPSLQSSGKPGLHGQLSLLSTVDPDLGGREMSWSDWQEILDGPTKDKLGGRETVLCIRSVPVLHDGSGYLVLVRGPIRPGVVHEDSLGGLDGGLGTKVGVGMVG